MTGDQYVSETNPITKKDGWWSRMVGVNKPIDTNKYYVICSNVIGGCAGTTGPKEINFQTNVPYGREFPAVTVTALDEYPESLNQLDPSSEY